MENILTSVQIQALKDLPLAVKSNKSERITVCATTELDRQAASKSKQTLIAKLGLDVSEDELFA